MINHRNKHNVIRKAIIGNVIAMIAFLPLAHSETQTNATDLTHANVRTRSLAASCAACHGTQGNTVNVGETLSSGKPVNLAGINPAYFSEQMLAFRSDKRIGTVMNHHAKGLNDDEIAALAQFFSRQIIKSPSSLPHQTLLKSTIDE
jgi:sulfide dehydrogenase cytochrome subunit